MLTLSSEERVIEKLRSFSTISLSLMSMNKQDMVSMADPGKKIKGASLNPEKSPPSPSV